MTKLINITIRAIGPLAQSKIIDYIPNYDISSWDRNIAVRNEYAHILGVARHHIMIHRESK